MTVELPQDGPEADGASTGFVAGPYAGRALHPSLPYGRQDCTLAIEQGFLVAKWPDRPELPVDLACARLQFRGVDGAEWAIEGTQPGEPTLTSRDLALVAALTGLEIGPLSAQIEAGRRQRNRSRLLRWVVAPVVLTLLLGVLPWLALEGLSGLVADHLPASLEAQLGEMALESSAEAMGGAKAVLADAEVDRLLALVVDRLAKARPAEPRPRLHLYKSHVVNAFALPGGHILLTTGLLRELKSADQLTGVVAHEWSHLRHRHGVRHLVRRAGLFLVIAALVGDSGALATVVLQGAGEVLDLGHTRAMEEQADSDAVAQLRDAGLSPLVLAEALSAIDQQATGAADLPAFLLSHPATTERLQAIRQAAGKATAPGPVLAVDWLKLTKRLGGD